MACLPDIYVKIRVSGKPTEMDSEGCDGLFIESAEIVQVPTPKLYGLVSYCTTHDTYPDKGDPCWECANPHIIAADLSAAREGFDRGYTKGTKFVDELEARIANLVIDKNETFWRGYSYAIEVVTRLGRENMP